MNKYLLLLPLLASCATGSVGAESPAVDVVKKYYAAYNAGDAAGEAAVMAENVIHESNQGKATTGRAAYLEFTKGMKPYFKETCTDIHYYTTSEPSRVVAESTVVGTYIKTSAGYPKATGQAYKLRVVESFEVSDKLISRISTFYNEQEWLRQVSGKK